MGGRTIDGIRGATHGSRIRLGSFGHPLHPSGPLHRDITGALTVLDTSLCPTVSGKVWQVEFVLPDLRAPLPINLTLIAVHRAAEGYFIRAAVRVLRSSMQLVSSWQGLGRLIRINLGSDGLPFFGSDCLGWSHGSTQGLAFSLGPGSPQTEMFPSLTRPADVSTVRPVNYYQERHRTYLVQFSAVPRSDPFVCFSRVMLGTRSMTEADALFNSRTQVHCCYNSPLQAKTQELPACFGVAPDRRHGEVIGYTWLHPSHCCANLTLAQAVVASVRCETSVRQSPWLVALSNAAKCLSLCCSGKRKVCTTARLLFARRSFVSHHRRRISGRRFRQRDGISTVADCPAGAAVLGLLHDISGTQEDSVKGKWTLHSAGALYDGYCAIYGYDSSQCCLHSACQGHARECVSCLLSEVSWGFWSSPQRRILAHAVRKLAGAAASATFHIPATLQSAVRALLAKSPPSDYAKVHPKTFLVLLAVLLQALELTGRPHLYDAIHSLQVAAPLELIPPITIAQLLDELPDQFSKTEAPLGNICAQRTASIANCLVHVESFGADTGVRFCGLAGASLIAALTSASSSRCCQEGAWPVLVRAVAEGNHWISAVFVMCILCEAAPCWQRGRLMETIKIVDDYLSCPVGSACPWKSIRCGKTVWTPVLERLRAQIACVVPSLGAPTLHSKLASAPTTHPIGLPRFRNHSDTMAFLQRGGSLIRMNDGEQLMMHPEFNGPLTRLSDTALRLRFSATAICPGLCVGLLDPDDEPAINAMGPTHSHWWTTRGFRLTRTLFRDGLFPANRTYCFGLVTYRPKSGPGRMLYQDFVAAWDLVFANRSVLLVSAPDSSFATRCGDCVRVSNFLYGRGKRLPPFRLARRVGAMNPNFLTFAQATGVEFGDIITNVRTAAAEAKADTVAVSWGPYADILVAELVCRGLRALDIGNLFHILQGGPMAAGVDPDEP